MKCIFKHYDGQYAQIFFINVLVINTTLKESSEVSFLSSDLLECFIKSDFKKQQS